MNVPFAKRWMGLEFESRLLFVVCRIIGFIEGSIKVLYTLILYSGLD